MASVPPDVVPDSGPRDHWTGSALSVSDVRLEHRMTASSTNSLGTPRSPRLRGRTPTPTWTEGTPSYTESTCSGDQGEWSMNRLLVAAVLGLVNFIYF